MVAVGVGVMVAVGIGIVVGVGVGVGVVVGVGVGVTMNYTYDSDDDMRDFESGMLQQGLESLRFTRTQLEEQIHATVEEFVNDEPQFQIIWAQRLAQLANEFVKTSGQILENEDLIQRLK